MQKKRLYFLAAAALIFVAFCWLLPAYFTYEMELILAPLAGIGVALCIYQVIKPSAEKIYTPENYEAGKANRGLAIFGCVILFIVVAVSVFFSQVSREEKYIRDNGVITEGTIDDGVATTHVRSRGSSTSYQVDVHFMADGKEQRQSLNIDKNEWDKVGKEMKVVIVYPKGHPEMCKLLLGPSAVKKYCRPGAVKPLSLKDFIYLYSHRESIYEVLLQFSPGWMKADVDSLVEVYYNTVFGNAISVTPLSLFFTENSDSTEFSAMLAEARKTLPVVYDSMSMNKKKGILFKDSSIQVRFIVYTKTETEEEDMGGSMKITIPVMREITHYEIGMASASREMLMPGDLVKESALDSARDIMDDTTQKKKLLKQLEKLREQ